MIRYVALFVLAALGLLYARWGEASPVKGTIILSQGRGGGRVVQEWSKTVQFKGGERACVVVMGDHNPILPITVEIFDEKGHPVAQDEPAKGVDEPKTPGNDIAAVFWYPPRDG